MEVSEANQRTEEGMKSMPLLCLLARWMLFFQKVDRLQPTPSPSGSSSGVHGHVNICEMCSVQGRTMSKCHLGQLPLRPHH